jgi:P-type Cu+ transporter
VSVAQYVVTAVGLAAIVWVLWYFLLSKGPGTAAAIVEGGGGGGGGGGVQEVHVVVKGGYTPDTVVVRAGTPVRLQFYRDETAECSERVVFEDFGIDTALPAFQTTPIEFTPEQAGEFRFRCGMSMLKGLLVVEPATADQRPSASPHAFHE